MLGGTADAGFRLVVNCFSGLRGLQYRAKPGQDIRGDSSMVPSNSTPPARRTRRAPLPEPGRALILVGMCRRGTAKAVTTNLRPPRSTPADFNQAAGNPAAATTNHDCRGSRAYPSQPSPARGGPETTTPTRAEAGAARFCQAAARAAAAHRGVHTRRNVPEGNG